MRPGVEQAADLAMDSAHIPMIAKIIGETCVDRTILERVRDATELHARGDPTYEMICNELNRYPRKDT